MQARFPEWYSARASRTLAAMLGQETLEGWTRARLIPTVGIRGQDEQEKWATSSLLAVMFAVPDFGLDVAREHGIDAVLTISNDITSGPEDSPVAVDRRKLRSVKLLHQSWWRILTEAIVQHRHRGVADPDQAWILDELIAYLDDERSGASGFQDMGEHWVKVRNGAGDGTLRTSDTEVQDIAGRWDQFVEYVCLGLGQDLGRDVRPVRPRKQTANSRTDDHCKGLVSDGTLGASIRVPDAAGDIVLRADLRAKKVITSVEIAAPADGRPLTRVKWLVKQLKDAPPGLILEASFVSQHQGEFRLTLAGPMGSKRGKGERSFVLETRKQTIVFYRDLVQDLKQWRASAPKLPEPDEPTPDALTPESHISQVVS